jgi:hypothetical protein
VGRMYQQVRSRPRYVVQAVLESDVDSFAARDLSSGRPAHDAARLVPQSK